MAQTVLQIEQLKKVYANGVTALHGIDLNVKEGDFFALLGPNGAGKSTTIGITCTLVNKTSGNVIINGYDLDSQAADAKKSVGLVPQEFNCHVFEPVIRVLLTQAGYYGIPRRVAKVRAEHYLKKLGLWEKRNDQVRELSGGMKRRLLIARALIHEPKLLFLDEPTAGVDIEIRRTMWEFFSEINNNGTTIILTTHYLEEAENLCKHIAIINHGRIVENTQMSTLLARLHCETFILNLATPLLQLPIITGFTVRQTDSTTLEVDITQTQMLNDLFAILSQHNIVVSSLRNKANRLEELFLRMIDKKQEVIT